jgi:putative ABC transport system substrate-binding protein
VNAALQRGLADAGYTDGKNVRISYRWADGHFEWLPRLANELVVEHPSVIVAAGGEMPTRAAMSVAPAVPIVFLTGTDPVKTGLVSSLSRPGGNLTGVTIYSTEIQQKRFELLGALVPAAKIIGVLLNPQEVSAEAQRTEAENAARSLWQTIHILEASTDREIEAAFDAVKRLNIDALVVGTDPFFSMRREQIVDLAKRCAVPAIFDSRLQVAAGGLVSYGTSYIDTYRQGGIYAGRILKGERPADLPILLPTKFDLVINLKTAKALGLTVPPSLLARADEVIE